MARLDRAVARRMAEAFIADQLDQHDTGGPVDTLVETMASELLDRAYVVEVLTSGVLVVRWDLAARAEQLEADAAPAEPGGDG